MKRKMKHLVFAFSILFVADGALAEKHEMPEVKTSAELDRMKTLVGTWKGSAVGMPEKTVEVQYRLSSGGSAVVETISPGTPHEMTTVYFDEAGKLAMTHYCMLGNHPTMYLTKSSATELQFDVLRTSDEKHMNALDITFKSADEMDQRWGMVDGKKSEMTTFTLRRES